MKNRIIILLLMILFLMNGCELKSNNIYLIDDNINSSTFSDYIKILNINKVTEGWVKGFLTNQKKIVVAKSNDTSYNLSTVSVDNPATDNKEIFKSSSPIIPYIEVSPVDMKVLAGDTMINIDSNITEVFQISSTRSDTTSEYASYSFLTGGEPVFIDFEYLCEVDYEHYYETIKTLSSGLAIDEKQNFDMISTWFFKNTNDSWYLNFRPVSMHKLYLPSQKYFFISSYGNTSYTFGSSLWCYDFRTRNLSKIDDNVKTFDVSSDLNLIGYVKNKDGNDSLMTYNYNDSISKTNKKLIATFPNISGLQFSPSGKWISFSAGEKQKNDIYLSSSYDSKLIEQLTHGYNSTGKMYWSKDSRRIAFNSFKKEGLPQNPDIYSIDITIKKEKNLLTTQVAQSSPFLDSNNETFSSDKFYNSLLYISRIINIYK